MLAVRIRKLDTKEIEKDLWEKKSLPPSWLDKLTPHDFAAMFLRSSDSEETGGGEALAMMVKANRERGQSGQQPLIPPSLLEAHNPRRPKVDQDPGPLPSVAPLDGMVAAAPVGPIRR